MDGINAKQRLDKLYNRLYELERINSLLNLKVSRLERDNEKLTEIFRTLSEEIENKEDKLNLT